MQIKLKYFGEVAEVTGTSEETIVEKELNTEYLCRLLNERYSGLNAIDYRLAINQTISDENIELNESDEIAFLPPFSGG